LTDRFTEILDELRDLHNRKSADYGSAGDSYANVRGSEAWGIPGWLGAMLRANDKVKRLQAFANNGRLANEGVEDAFKDLAVYAVIGLLLYQEAAHVARHNPDTRILSSPGYRGYGLADATGWPGHIEGVQGVRSGTTSMVCSSSEGQIKGENT
jgi:hypothetical protein